MKAVKIVLAVAGLLVGMGVVMETAQKRQSRKSRRELRRRYKNIDLWSVEL